MAPRKAPTAAPGGPPTAPPMTPPTIAPPTASPPWAEAGTDQVNAAAAAAPATSKVFLRMSDLPPFVTAMKPGVHSGTPGPKKTPHSSRGAIHFNNTDGHSSQCHRE